MEELTNCEVMVMKMIWHSDEAMSVQEIMRAVNVAYDEDWKAQTVSTFLSKMVKKGYLDMQRKGRYFFYYPLVTEREYADREIKKCVELWGDGKIDGLLAAFTKIHKLMEEERQRIGGCWMSWIIKALIWSRMLMQSQNQSFLLMPECMPMSTIEKRLK